MAGTQSGQVVSLGKPATSVPAAPATVAIADYGRAGAKPSDRAHIVSRARALGLEGKLPLAWVGRKAA